MRGCPPHKATAEGLIHGGVRPKGDGDTPGSSVRGQSPGRALGAGRAAGTLAFSPRLSLKTNLLGIRDTSQNSPILEFNDFFFSVHFPGCGTIVTNQF